MRIHRPRNRRRPDARVALLLGALGVFSSVTLLQHWRGHDSLLEEEPRTAPVEPTRAVVTYLPSLRYTRDESKMRTDADCAPGILYLLSVRYLSDGRWFPALSLVRALQPNDATVHTQANAFAHTQVQRPGDANDQGVAWPFICVQPNFAGPPCSNIGSDIADHTVRVSCSSVACRCLRGVLAEYCSGTLHRLAPSDVSSALCLTCEHTARIPSAPCLPPARSLQPRCVRVVAPCPSMQPRRCVPPIGSPQTLRLESAARPAPISGAQRTVTSGTITIGMATRGPAT
jgi:hypothetical protein